MSIAGGVTKAVERAVAHGCEALQIFTKNASQWRGKPLELEAIRTFRRRVGETGITPVVSHASYLINLATADAVLRDLSLQALVDELDRAEALGLLGVVIHPGTCTSGTEAEALARVAATVRTAFRSRSRQRTLLVLEHTAGQGRSLGYCFEHLAAILDHLDGSPRVGFCLDTCHLVASGYDLLTDTGFATTIEGFDRLVGIHRLKVLHANDSKRPCGSRVDRHEHIGEGCLGLEPFRRILNDPRFAGRPMLIETEKSPLSERAGAIQVDPLDVKNLDALRRLRGQLQPAVPTSPG
ncbi:MAG: deoxyribonuclease IV [Acidobacteria bacterium]|nr:deoxyribonuclease IV [Acidobacteriota bacterium]